MTILRRDDAGLPVTSGVKGHEGDVLETNGGYRAGRIVEGQVEVWLCPHVHRTRREAECCPSKTPA